MTLYHVYMTRRMKFQPHLVQACHPNEIVRSRSSFDETRREPKLFCGPLYNWCFILIEHVFFIDRRKVFDYYRHARMQLLSRKYAF